MLAGLVELALAAKGLGDAEVDFGVLIVEIQSFLPAIEGFVEKAAVEEAQADVVEALGALFFVLARDVEHLLGFVVIAELAVDVDAVALAGFEGGIDLLDLVEDLQGVLLTTRA